MNTDTLLTTILIGNLLLSAVISWAAAQRDRSALGWFFISLFLSPLIAAIILALAGRGQSTKRGADPALGDLSRLSEADLETIQQHQAAQRASKNQRQNLPQRLE